MKLVLTLAVGAGLLGSGNVSAQTTPDGALPTGTPLWLETHEPVPLHVGQPVRAFLTHPVYARNRVVLPAGTLLAGTITALVPERSHRLQSRLRGDFTPFSEPVVQFTTITATGGQTVPVKLTAARAGAPLLRLTPPPPQRGGFVRKQIDAGLSAARDELHVFTGPDKRDRFVQFLYTQLPYHPQRIERATAWTVETIGPLALPESAEKAVSTTAVDARSRALTPVSAGGAGAQSPLQVEAAFNQDMTSESTATGQKISATVVQPTLAADGSVAIPEGAILEGTVTKAKHSARFGRAGELRFNFSQLSLPGEEHAERIQSNITGIDASRSENLKLDREGSAKPAPKDKVVVPLLLLALATRPLDRDGGRHSGIGRNAVASNSLGLAGFIVGTAAGQANAAAAIGFYGTALAVWNRWIKRGQEVSFKKNTRLVLETTVRRSAPL